VISPFTVSTHFLRILKTFCLKSKPLRGVLVGGHWEKIGPFYPRECTWAGGEDLDGARRDLAHFISLPEAGHGDEIMIDPLTQKPFKPR
jgi:hypothetical protein